MPKKKQDNTLQEIDNENMELDAHRVRFQNIALTHGLVSNMKTPKAYIKDKMGMDYVEIGYMKQTADRHYPGWSWQIINTEFAGTEAFVVHGRLMWYDSGVKRIGDMTAAHRIQKKKGSSEYVDLGNDIKSANTDCMKKAFNMYMNIADDVYRNQVRYLSDAETEEFMDLRNKHEVPDAKQNELLVRIRKGKIHKYNLKEANHYIENYNKLTKKEGK